MGLACVRFCVEDKQGPGATVVVVEGDERAVEPRSLARNHLDPTRVHVVSLEGETVAQIVWFRGDYRIQVNQDIPVGLRAAVVRHTVEAHQYECYPRVCPRANEFLEAAEDARQRDRQSLASRLA